MSKTSLEQDSTRGGYREGSGRKPGYESTLRKTGYTTKVTRVPEHWNVADIFDGLEMIQSVIETYSEQIESVIEKHGKSNSRWIKLADCIDELRSSFPMTYFDRKRWQSLSDDDLNRLRDQSIRRMSRQRRKTLRDRLNQV